MKLKRHDNIKSEKRHGLIKDHCINSQLVSHLN